MSTPQHPDDSTASRGSLRPSGAELPPDELGNTAQFRAFVNDNDDAEQARERAAADPDGERMAPADLPDDREIQFSAPAPMRNERPSARSAEADLPPSEVGSTEQFRAFADSSDDDPNAAAADRGSLTNDRAMPQPDTVLPEDRDPTSSEIMGSPKDRGAQIQPTDLPPINPDNKRNMYIALAVLGLVIIVVVLLLALS